jgi:hypothetical protein
MVREVSMGALMSSDQPKVKVYFVRPIFASHFQNTEQ